MKKYIKYLIILVFGIIFTSCTDTVYEPNIVRYEVVQYGTQHHIHYYPPRRVVVPRKPPKQHIHNRHYNGKRR